MIPEEFKTEDVKKEIADWIDDEVIADTILDTLKAKKISRTVENAKLVWLDMLYTELGDAVKRSVEALADQGSFDEDSVVEPDDDVQLPEKIATDGSIAK